MLKKLLVVMSVLLSINAVNAGKLSSCQFKGIALYGKVKFVDSFADIKIQIVNSFPDLKVQLVKGFANECGKWQVVDNFPDFTVQVVSAFPDIKVQKVSSFPGL